MGEPQHDSNQYTDDQTNYWIHVMILDTNTNNMIYNVDLCLIPPKKLSPVFVNIFQNGGKKKFALECFENFRYTLQKNLSKLEFPDFPNGNSGKSFRSIYQLNHKLKAGSF